MPRNHRTSWQHHSIPTHGSKRSSRPFFFRHRQLFYRNPMYITSHVKRLGASLRTDGSCLVGRWRHSVGSACGTSSALTESSSTPAPPPRRRRHRDPRRRRQRSAQRERCRPTEARGDRGGCSERLRGAARCGSGATRATCPRLVCLATPPLAIRDAPRSGGRRRRRRRQSETDSARAEIWVVTMRAGVGGGTGSMF